MSTHFVRSCLRLSVWFTLLLALSAAALAALCVAGDPAQVHVMLNDQSVEGGAGVALAAAGGGAVALVLVLVMVGLAALLGLLLPFVAIVVLLAVALGLALLVLCALGGLALASAPVLLLVVGCVLLLRVLQRRAASATAA